MGTITGHAALDVGVQPGGGAGRRHFAMREGGRPTPCTDPPLQAALAAARDGSRDAIRYLYCRYADTVYAYVKSILGDEHDAEDITQSVFAKLITRIGRYEPRGVPFEAWLLRVARNATLDYMRQRRLVPVEDLRRADGPDDGGATERQAASLREAFSELTCEQRRVILLRHVAGLTPPEIAKLIGRSEAAVHGLHHRGRQALRRSLTERGAQPAVRGSA